MYGLVQVEDKWHGEFQFGKLYFMQVTFKECYIYKTSYFHTTRYEGDGIQHLNVASYANLQGSEESLQS